VNYKKIILVGFISAFVAILTSVLGVAGTVIGSVVSSVLYNMLSEALEKPVSNASFRANFEWELAYIFPLVVIALIQLLLIFAMLSEFGILPSTFLTAYLSLQNLANNSLYRILGIAMIIISIYPIVMKKDIIKKARGAIIAFVGVIFLARGFVDLGNTITDIYDDVFIYFDFPIAVIAFILIVFVIVRILLSDRGSESGAKSVDHESNEDFSHNVKRVRHSKKHKDFDYGHKRENTRTKRHEPINESRTEPEVTFKSNLDNDKPEAGINQSSENIQFESNDLLDDYKK
jgi:hypothetical protein